MNLFAGLAPPKKTHRAISRQLSMCLAHATLSRHPLLCFCGSFAPTEALSIFGYHMCSHIPRKIINGHGLLFRECIGGYTKLQDGAEGCSVSLTLTVPHMN